MAQSTLFRASFIFNIFQLNPPFRFDLNLMRVSVVAKMMAFVTVPKFLCYICMLINGDFEKIPAYE